MRRPGGHNGTRLPWPYRAAAHGAFTWGVLDRLLEHNTIDIIGVTGTLFPAVEIDGEHYWDGGLAGNPAMAGLIKVLPKCDFMIVRIDPVIRKEMPRTARDIHDRVTELSFNTTFWLELSAIAVILDLVEEGELDRKRFGRFFLDQDAGGAIKTSARIDLFLGSGAYAESAAGRMKQPGRLYYLLLR